VVANARNPSPRPPPRNGEGEKDKSTNNNLIAKNERSGVAWPGVDMLDAAQVSLVVLQSTVAEAAGEELHHAEARDDPIREVAYRI
jgi:hypothetical protein